MYAAGPVMYTRPSASFHSIRRSPPRRCTVTSRAATAPYSIAATADAHAPVPQAIVSPLPRS